MKFKTSTLLQITLFSSFLGTVCAQHNYEFFNNGALVHVQAGAEIHVNGDVHNYQSIGRLENNGLIVCQGNMYSDNQFQQRGTGTTRLRNNNVNAGQVQFINGSYAVRGGQSQIGVNDGSFFNLELANDQGIVWLNGSGYVADVRNVVDFNGVGAPVVNRIVTANPTALPANGSNYPAVFGIMNPTAGHGSALDNTVVTNGNNSGVDNGYVQGKLRRAVSAAGGIYNFVTKRGLCAGKNSKISWTQVETGSSITWKYPSCILKGDNSVGEFYSVAITNNKQQADTGTKMIHIGKNTKSTIVSKGISAGRSQNAYRGLVKMMKSAEGARNFSQCDSMLMGNECGAHTFPYIEIKNPTATVEHEASTSKIGEDQIFYCNQRGISTEDAVSMIVHGFCKEVLNELPMEFAVEARRLLEISLEGSVG
jgi:Fe-S cluster assembly scaffold protein SufB